MKSLKHTTTAQPNKINMSKIGGLSVLFLSLTACQTIPKAQTEPVVANPQIATEQPYQTYDSQTISNANQPSIAHQRWQDFYSDANLKQLIALGLENNKGIEAQILAIESAKAQYRIKDNANVPNLSATGSAGYKGDFDGNNSDNYSVGLGTSYEFDFWGKVANQKQASLEQFFATAAAKDTAQITLISNIAQAYVNYGYINSQLALAEKTLKNRDQAYQINRKRFQAGLDSELTSAQSLASVESVKKNIAQLTTQRLQAQNAISALVGLPADNRVLALLPKQAVKQITQQKVFSTGLPSELLLYRPDLRKAEHELKAAGANVNIARASYFPNISLSANAGTGSLSLGDLFKSGSFSWGITPSINLPIFNPSLTQQYNISEIAQRQALSQYEQNIQTAFTEVKDALATRATLNAQLNASVGATNANKKSYDISYARFRAGLDNYLGVLSAETGLYNSEQEILAIGKERLLSEITLYKVLGGGANVDVPLEAPIDTHKNASDYITDIAKKAKQ
ncbi:MULTISPECIES: efflux transporter outer membrane subunit [unclassified Moraxella]|uniref:efflux transporter outer membrane subunit n=1 Tax=unclassified Moraxella TaxID=2685852 RepID=UPI003AF69560